jgi:hypothetical protein
MLAPFAGQFGGLVYFTIYAIEIAGFRRQEINTLGKPESP